MKWVFYVIVFGYMFYRAVFGQILTVEPENNDGFLKVGEHKTISCKASNKNQKVKWIDPKGNEIQRVPSGRVFSQQHFVKGRIPALILTITKASIQDTGVYQCRSGEVLKNVSICVIDPSEFIDTPTEVTADLGRSITLTCQAKGEPEPRLLWSRNDQTVTDEDSSDKYKVMTKYNIQGFEGLLTITSLDPEDSGIYSCLSLQESVQNENCNLIKTLNITLNVNYAPIFENGNETENVYSKSNQEVQIECSASGYPKPTYKWYKESDDGVLFEYDQKQIKIIEENKAALSIFANYSTFGGRYKCVASNDIGTSTKYFILMQMMKPRRPSEVHLYDSTENSVKLNVTWYDEIIFPVAAIEVHYIKDNNQRRSVPSSWKSADSIEVEINNVDPEEQGIIFTVPGLETATEYWVRLRAKNDAGESAWSDPSFVTTSVQELVTVSFDGTTEAPIEDEEDPESSSDDDVSDATFYGIFFAGGVLVLAVACTFLMRLVK